MLWEIREIVNGSICTVNWPHAIEQIYKTDLMEVSKVLTSPKTRNCLIIKFPKEFHAEE
jgi:hypothetical protein